MMFLGKVSFISASISSLLRDTMGLDGESTDRDVQR